MVGRYGNIQILYTILVHSFQLPIVKGRGEMKNFKIMYTVLIGLFLCNSAIFATNTKQMIQNVLIKNNVRVEYNWLCHKIKPIPKVIKD